MKPDYLKDRERVALPRPHWRWKRRRDELSAIIAQRCGGSITDDDAGREYLALMLNHIVRLAGKGVSTARATALICAKWLSYDELDAMIEHAQALNCGPNISAEALGKELRLTAEERDKMGLTTIAPFDAAAIRARQRRAAQATGRKRGRPRLNMPDEERLMHVRQQGAKRIMRLRERNGKIRSAHSYDKGMNDTQFSVTQSSLTETKEAVDRHGLDEPWTLFNVSRATYFRRKAKTINRLLADMDAGRGSAPAQPIMQGLRGILGNLLRSSQ